MLRTGRLRDLAARAVRLAPTDSLFPGFLPHSGIPSANFDAQALSSGPAMQATWRRLPELGRRILMRACWMQSQCIRSFGVAAPTMRFFPLPWCHLALQRSRSRTVKRWEMCSEYTTAVVSAAQRFEHWTQVVCLLCITADRQPRRPATLMGSGFSRDRC